MREPTGYDNITTWRYAPPGPAKELRTEARRPPSCMALRIAIGIALAATGIAQLVLNSRRDGERRLLLMALGAAQALCGVLIALAAAAS